MADIGSTLRETRIREKIDITTVEQSTKIRTKYLRALENEEWAVLPGPTYVKSFLRTYAEFLGLDAHMLIEEYRARYEQPEELEVPAFTRDQPLRTRVSTPGPRGRTAAITALAVGLLVILFVLGVTGKKGGGGSGNGASKPGARHLPKSRQGSTPAPAPKRTAPASGKVRVSVIAARPVWVCLVDAAGKALVGGRTLAAGERAGPFSGKRFRVTVGNGGGDLRIDGKLLDVPDSSVPSGYSVSAAGTRTLNAAQRPTCSGGSSSGNGAAAP
jgi:cytoskeleton protein RodZ